MQEDHVTVPSKLQEKIIFIIECMLCQTIHRNEGKIQAFFKNAGDSIFISYVHLLNNFLEEVLQLNGGKKNSRREN